MAQDARPSTPEIIQKGIEEQRRVSPESLEKVAQTTIRDTKDSDDSEKDVLQSTPVHTWTPGFWEQFPWLGFAGLCTVLISMALSVTILMNSDKKITKLWPSRRYRVAPNVLVNITNQIGNLGLLAAIGQGLAIAWWRKALRGGTIRALHRNHNFTSSFLAILTSGKHFNLIALAALATKFTVIDSTLFQKATKVVVDYAVDWNTYDLQTWAMQEWPQNKGGFVHADGDISLSGDWAGVLDAYKDRVASNRLHDQARGLELFVGCPSNQECRGQLKSLGFRFNCTQSLRHIDYGQLYANNDTQGREEDGEVKFPLWNVTFDTNWASSENPHASISFNMSYMNSINGDNGSCPGELMSRECEILPAMVSYPLTLISPTKDENTGEYLSSLVQHIKFFSIPEKDYAFQYNFTDAVHQIDNITVLQDVSLDEDGSKETTVGALTEIFNTLFESTANASNFDGHWHLDADGELAKINYFSNYSDDDERNGCGFPVDVTMDPTIDILRRINTLGLITALFLDEEYSLNITDRHKERLQIIKTSANGVVDRYHTDIGFMVGAVVATVVTVACVLPVFWGFWELGRKVTLGPLEIARAFNAPVLATNDARGDGDIDDLITEVGKRNVQYGYLQDINRLGIAEPARVAKPAYNKPAVDNVRAGVGLASVGVAAVAAGIVGNNR